MGPFARLSLQLSTPFECAVTAMYHIPDEADENRELAKILTEINESKPITARDGTALGKSMEASSLVKLLTEQLSTRFGIVSFTTDPYHPLMWSTTPQMVQGSSLATITLCSASFRGPWAGCEVWIIRTDLLRSLDPSYWAKVHLPILLSVKSGNWSYEKEWRLIVELNRTIGTGEADQLGQPVNLLQIPNEAVVSVLYTERTPHETVKVVRERLADKNNRYRADKPRRLVLSSMSYSYEEAPGASQS